MVFVHVPGSQLLKHWEFPTIIMVDKGVFCYVNGVTVGPHPGAGLVARRTYYVIRGLELLVPAPSPTSGRDKGQEVESTNG